MAAPSVSCELFLKSGERTNFKCDLASNDGKFSHQSVRDAISKVKFEVNEFLTIQVEKDKQESAQLKKSGETPNVKSGSAGTTGAGEADKTEGGNDSDDMGLEEDEDDEDQDSLKTTDCGDQTNKRDASNCDSTSNKKSKLSDS